MPDTLTGPSTTTQEYARLIGRQVGDRPGPKLVVCGGIHGNEPAGVAAARRVLQRLADRDFTLSGEFVAVVGNLRALSKHQRYLSRDLNRLWTPDNLALMREARTEFEEGDERIEQQELLAVIDQELASATGVTYFIDLHTTSADGIPFVLIGDTLRHRAFAKNFPLPVILGLEEAVDGVLLEYMTERGCITLGVEGGQHDNPASIDSLESILWLALEAAGLVEAGALPQQTNAFNLLNRVRRGLPRVMEVTYRHPIKPEHQFRMEKGFANIHPVKKGDLLARDWRGEIRAKADGFVILPLYQGKGEDGFFFGGRVARWRMDVGHILRKLHVEVVLPLLPGVRRDPQRHDALRVDTRVARLFPGRVFRAFGYRKVRQMGRSFLFARRPTV